MEGFPCGFCFFDRFIQICQLFFQPVVFTLQQRILCLQGAGGFLRSSDIGSCTLDIGIHLAGFGDRFFDLCFQFAVFPFQIIVEPDLFTGSLFGIGKLCFQRLESGCGVIQFLLEISVFLFQENFSTGIICESLDYLALIDKYCP